MKRLGIALICSIALLSSASAAGTRPEGSWWEGFGSPPYPPGVNDPVTCATTYQGSLILGGAFTEAAGMPASFIVGWDGSFWFPLGEGLSAGAQARALIVYNGDLIAGGYFRGAGGFPANYVARWDGTEWHSMGNGFDRWVNALTIWNGQLIAAGDFTGRIAAWDGVTWTPIAPGIQGEVKALTVYNGDLIAGGWFTQVNGVQFNCIARWDGTQWHPLGSGMTEPVQAGVLALGEEGGDLVAGGKFAFAGGIPASNIARWDGSEWSAMGNGMSSAVESLYAGVTGFYAGGQFLTPGSRIVRWDGSAWQRVGGGTDDLVAAITEWNGFLIAGGWFEQAGGVEANYVATWDGETWATIGPAHSGEGLLGNAVNALLPFEGDLVVGGDFFINTGQTVVNNARWDGTSWSPLGSNYEATRALAEYNGSLYRATYLGVERWDGASWVLVSPEYIDTYALTVYGDALFAAGYRDVWRWNGASWVSIGTFDGDIDALAAYSGRLIAGGRFTSVEGIPARRIAAFDGVSWQPMGLGIGGTDAAVYALAVRDEALYVGGDFIAAGGVSASNIARWDGAWHALGAGTDLPVRAIGFFGTDLIVGGDFTRAGDADASRIARWDGVTWSPLGSGLSGGSPEFGRGFALASYGGDLYAGSYFTLAGGIPSLRIGRWIEGTADAPEGTRPGLRVFVPNPYRPGMAIRIAGDRSRRFDLDVYSVNGALVRHLSGEGEARWNGLTERGDEAPAGAYYLRAKSGASSQSRKVILLRH